MTLTARLGRSIAAYFVVSAADRPVLLGARRQQRQRVLPLRPQPAVVARRHVDGRDDVRRRHAAGRRRPRRAQRHRRQLDLVERGVRRHADRVLLRAAVAARRHHDRRRVRRAALHRPARGVPARLPRALSRACRSTASIIGWVNLAMAKILPVTLGWDRLTAVLVSLADHRHLQRARPGSGAWSSPTSSSSSSRWPARSRSRGSRCSCRQIGGLDGLRREGAARRRSSSCRRSPTRGRRRRRSSRCRSPASSTYVGVHWWASWYPGQEPGGGGYVAQRMMSAKDERHSLLATLWFTVAHYCVRPWPWILVGLASLVLYPDHHRQGSRLRDGDARSPAVRLARAAARRVLRRLHVDDLARSSIGARRTSSTTSIAASCGATRASSTTCGSSRVDDDRADGR